MSKSAAWSLSSKNTMFALSSSTSKTNSLRSWVCPLSMGNSPPASCPSTTILMSSPKAVAGLTQQPQQTATVPSQTTSLLDAHAFGSTRPSKPEWSVKLYRSLTTPERPDRTAAISDPHSGSRGSFPGAMSAPEPLPLTLASRSAHPHYGASPKRHPSATATYCRRPSPAV
jgi:hypothetical protein